MIKEDNTIVSVFCTCPEQRYTTDITTPIEREQGIVSTRTTTRGENGDICPKCKKERGRLINVSKKRK